jgi:hypothetical protein
MINGRRVVSQDAERKSEKENEWENSKKRERECKEIEK